MGTVKMRAHLKKVVDRLPPERLASLADYAGYLERPTLVQRVKTAQKEIAAGKGMDWRTVRSDV